MTILKNVTILGLIVASCALSAADYTLTKSTTRESGTWWTSGSFKDSSGNVVASPHTATVENIDGKYIATAVSPIDNLYLAENNMSVFLNGADNGMYMIKNLQGSSTADQTMTFITNSNGQNAHIANITGTSAHKLTVNFGLSTDTQNRNSLYRTYTDFDVDSHAYKTPANVTSTTSYSYANVNVYGVLYTNNLVLKNGSKLIVKPNTTSATKTTFKTLTVNKGTFVELHDTGSSLYPAGQYKVNDYINLNGTADFYGDKGSFVINNKIRFDGGTLRLHGTELLTQNDSGTKAISLNVYGGGARIELGGNESFDYIAFTKDSNGKTVQVGSETKTLYKDSTRTITFALDDSTTLLSINKLFNGLNDDYTTSLNGKDVLNADGTTTYSWTTFIEFENFKDGVVKITQDLTADELATSFKAEGWQNFTQDTNGFLHATQVPEPATVAGIFGVVALAFAYRRKK